jgi:RNA polymerase sigma-70 factor (ECF subfamily)
MMFKIKQPSTAGPGAAPAVWGALDPEAAIRAALERNDHQGALDLLVRAYSSMVRRYCSRMIRDEALADDLCQTVFLQAYEGLGRLHSGTRIRSWLFSIAHHRCLDASKVNRRWQKRFELLGDMPDGTERAASVDELMVQQSFIEALRTCRDELPSEERTAVLLRYVEGLTYAEMSRICKEPIATLRERVARGVMKLAKLLTARGYRP